MLLSIRLIACLVKNMGLGQAFDCRFGKMQARIRFEKA